MLRPNGGRQQLRKTISGLRLDGDPVVPLAGASSSSSSLPPHLPLPESSGSPPLPSGSGMPGVYPAEHHVHHHHHHHHHTNSTGSEHEIYSIPDEGLLDDPDSEAVGGQDSMDASFALYGHSNESADLYSINSTSGFRETTEELDSLAVENIVLREDLGRISLFLQRNYPDIFTQVNSQATHIPYPDTINPPAPPLPRSSSLSSPGPPPPPQPAQPLPPTANNSSTSSLQAQLKRKDHDLTTLHHQRSIQETEITSLRRQIKGLHDFIIQSRNKVQQLEGIVDYDDVYFEREFKQLAASVKDWCWKLSRGAGIFVGEEEDREVIGAGGGAGGKGKRREGAEEGDREKPCLRKSEIERLMKTHSKIGVITAFVVDKMWKGCWGRYAPGLTDEEERILRQLEEEMRKSDKIPMAAINRWRASTLSLVSKSPNTSSNITTQTTLLTSSITHALSRLLVTPPSPTSPNLISTTSMSNTNPQPRPSPSDERSLTRILEKAITLYAQLRSQKSRFELTYPGKGDKYDCRIMEDASDIVVYDEEDLMGGTVGAVAFPGVVKWGEEQEGGRLGGGSGEASLAGEGGEVQAEGGAVTGAAAGPGQAAGGGGTGSGKPRVLVKARVLVLVLEEPDE